MHREFLPFHMPDIGEAEVQAVVDTLAFMGSAKTRGSGTPQRVLGIMKFSSPATSTT